MLRTLVFVLEIVVLTPTALALLAWLAGVRYIPHSRVGIVEKLWSRKGSLTGGGIVARNGEAGFQTALLRGGLHVGFFPWQYRIHRQPLVTVGEGKVGYVYARDGEPLAPAQTLGRIVSCNYAQDAAAFLAGGGQRGRQRAILREGVFAINLALFVVITEEAIYAGPVKDKDAEACADWQTQLRAIDGFDPIVIGRLAAPPDMPSPGRPETDGGLSPLDTVGIVTVHDGPSIASGEIIAPEVRPENGAPDHHYFQDPEAFLALGGRRGKQLQVLTDGTFYLNRWFATVELKPKTLIPIGYVGVVVSYFGGKGEDVTGQGFRYGEQVASGHRGVWRDALPPGKYALNPYALKVELVPTVNFVLRWVTGQVEAHQYDKDLASIELITADGYEPVLPLSLVLHIDYEKAPRVVQRFGDVRRLISQTLDPILTAYFRDVAQATNMLDLLTKREEIQARATEHLGRRFKDYDINCVAVLIGRPESRGVSGPNREDAIERLFDQLRARRLAEEQKETFASQQQAASHLRELNHAKAAAEKQAELTQSRIEIEVAANRADAQLAEAERLAKRDIARAGGEAQAREMNGRGEAARISQVGLAEATVSQQKIRAYGDPRLFVLNLVAEQIAKSAQPIVPERVLVMGGGNGGDGALDTGSFSVMGRLLTLLLSEKSGVSFDDRAPGEEDLAKLAAGLKRPTG